jgi:hypothetical protein
MPKLHIFPQGTSGGSAGPGRKPGDGGKKRGAVRGWSKGAARRNVAWLWSVDPDQLGSDGWAVTLTMGGWPESAVEWHAARRALLKRLDRDGIRAYHWIVEATALGRPHLHMALYGPGQLDQITALHWLAVCAKHGWEARWKAQHIVPIHDANGWSQYVAKHGARGVAHYQREEMPAGWEKSGRLWGKGGDWPEVEAMEWDLSPAEFHRYRRLLMSYLRAKMRAADVPPKSIRRLGQQLSDPELGRTAGVGYWVHEDISSIFVEMSLGRLPPEVKYEWME